jgi:hypothetical protein
MHVLQILEALRRLGHDVLFLEYLEHPPDAAASAWLGDLVARWWDPDDAAILDASTGRHYGGASQERVAGFTRDADAVLSLAAHYRAEPWPLLERIRPRILIETDPGYTHLWAAEDDPSAIFGEHDLYFTVGMNVGTPRSRIPTCGIDWMPLWPPVVLDWWPVGARITRNRLTTVGAWRDYGYLEYEGRVLGPKVEEFEHFIDLPRRAAEQLELTLAIDADDPDRKRLADHGWRIEDPGLVATPDAYRDYVAGSLGEFSCAKGGYVGTHSGWFSDRSACYLAAGRPVILQATGFEDVLPTGRGAFAVHDPDEAAAAIAAIRSDYAAHSAAARRLAEEFLGGERILAEALARAGLSSDLPR